MKIEKKSETVVHDGIEEAEIEEFPSKLQEKQELLKKIKSDRPKLGLVGWNISDFMINMQLTADSIDNTRSNPIYLKHPSDTPGVWGVFGVSTNFPSNGCLGGCLMTPQ
jgi:hypothetical protein